jgi:hypothetical protein
MPSRSPVILGLLPPSVPGAVLFDDFDSIQNTAIRTITGGVLNVGSAPTTPVTGNFIGQLRWLCLGNAGPRKRGRCI